MRGQVQRHCNDPCRYGTEHARAPGPPIDRAEWRLGMRGIVVARYAMIGMPVPVRIVLARC